MILLLCWHIYENRLDWDCLILIEIFPTLLVHLDFISPIHQAIVFVFLSSYLLHTLTEASHNKVEKLANVFVFQTICNTKMKRLYAVNWAELRRWVEVSKNVDFTNVFVFFVSSFAFVFQSYRTLLWFIFRRCLPCTFLEIFE